MSAPECKAAELDQAQKLRREKNRIAQQKHREKRKKDIEKKTKDVKKMMTILQKVKLAVALNDIGQIKELVKSPSIVLPVETSQTSVGREKTPFLEMEDLFPASHDAFSSSQPSVEVEVEATTTVESAAVESNPTLPSHLKDDNSNLISQNSLGSQANLSTQANISNIGAQMDLSTQNMFGTQGLFQPIMDPFFWNMANIFPSSQMQYFDTQSPLHLLPSLSMPNPWETPWEGYPAIMAGI